MTISSKLIWIVLLAVGGTIYVIIRKITAAVGKASVKGLVATLRKDPARAKDIAAALDLPYGKRENVSKEEFVAVCSSIQQASTIGDFIILYATEVDVTEYLVVTEIAFDDFDVSVTGNSTDVKKKAYHNFALRYAPDEKVLSVWSDLYDGTTAKFQKEAFSRRIVNPLG